MQGLPARITKAIKVWHDKYTLEEDGQCNCRLKLQGTQVTGVGALAQHAQMCCRSRHWHTVWRSTDLLQLGVEAVHMQILQVSIFQGHKYRGR